MDKLTVISGTLFMAADVFAIVSLAMPDWIITDVGGKSLYYTNLPVSKRLSLLSCINLSSDSHQCRSLIVFFCLDKSQGHDRTFLHTGDTRLGLMWSCITLYNRPQVCFTPDLQPEWLLALICIFIGCICITTTVILLASSHFDRNVIPYARWVGFAASK